MRPPLQAKVSRRRIQSFVFQHCGNNDAGCGMVNEGLETKARMALLLIEDEELQQTC